MNSTAKISIINHHHHHHSSGTATKKTRSSKSNNQQNDQNSLQTTVAANKKNNDCNENIDDILYIRPEVCCFLAINKFSKNSFFILHTTTKKRINLFAVIYFVQLH